MKNVADVLQQYDKILEVISNRWTDGLLINRSNIDAVFRLFSDEESCYLYGQELIFCLLKNFLNSDKASTFAGLMSDQSFKNYINKVVKENVCPELECQNTPSSHNIMNYCKATTFILEQYRYKNHVEISKGDICLDIGACLGDTSIYMIQKEAKYVHAFEIDNSNLECMQRSINKLNMTDHITIIKKAISNSNGEIYYTPSMNNIGGGYIGNQKSDESYVVPMVTIDSWCEENNIFPSFIKMDIEGAELDALIGAKNTLIKNSPKLAICIYHKWSHRWEIPLLLKEYLPEYKFYLKKSHPRSETVLLATP